MTVARYSDPLLRYGDGTIYRGDQAETGAGASGPVLPSRRSVTLRFYSRTTGLKVAEVSSGVGSQVLVDGEFELLPTGPGRFTFSLALATDAPTLPGGVSVTYGDRVDVHLWQDPDPIYSGALQRVPSRLASMWPFQFEAFGYFAQLDRVIIPDQTYSGQQVWQAVDHLISTYVEPRTGIVYASGQIDRGASYRLNELRLQKATCKAGLSQLAGLAGLYDWGVGADRAFYFRRENTATLHHWWIGKHLAESDVDEDGGNIVNRVYVQHGKRSSTGDQYLEAALDDEASQGDYGVWDGIVRAPNVYNTADAYRFASVELAKKAQPVLRARVRGIPYDGTPITCAGRARIVSRYGDQEETLRKRRVVYRLQAERVEVSVDLGEREPDLREWAADLAATQARLELAQQMAQRQIAL